MSPAPSLALVCVLALAAQGAAKPAAAQPESLAARQAPCAEWSSIDDVCPCLEAGVAAEEREDDPESRFRLSCEVTRAGENAMVLTVRRQPSPWQRMLYAAVRRGERWQVVADLGQASMSGAGGVVEEIALVALELLPAPSGGVLRIETEISRGNTDMGANRQDYFELHELTLCVIPEDPESPARCPLQLPLMRLFREDWFDAERGAKGYEERTGVPAPDLPREELLRLAVSLGADPRVVEIALEEGELPEGLKGLLGRHELR